MRNNAQQSPIIVAIGEPALQLFNAVKTLLVKISMTNEIESLPVEILDK